MDFFKEIYVQPMAIFVSFAAYFLGIKFPDWDFKMKLPHRNILTHSPLILLFFIKIYEEKPNDLFRFFIMGFSLALALHLIFDFFPRGWGGGALLHVPFKKRALRPKTTKILLVLFIILSLIIAVAYSHSLAEFFYLSLIGIITIFKDAIKEEKVVRPLLTFIISVFLIGLIRHESLILGIQKGIHFISSQFGMFF